MINRPTLTPVSSADNLCKQFGHRSGPTNDQGSGPTNRRADQGPNCLPF